MTHDPDLSRLADALDHVHHRLHTEFRRQERAADTRLARATALLHGHQPTIADLAAAALITGPATTAEVADAVRAAAPGVSFCGIHQALADLSAAGRVVGFHGDGWVLWARRTGPVRP